MGSAQPQRRPEAAFEQTGTMAAQPYDGSSPPRGDAPVPQPGEQPPPRSRSRARQDTHTVSNEETMISESPRRSRRKPQGGPPEPPGPPGPPTKNRGGWRRFVPSWKIIVASIVVLVAGLFGMIMVAYANTTVPTGTQDEATAQQSTIYYNDGKREIARLGTKREKVNLTQMAQTVRDATIAIENQTFYEDSGISIPGMIRSLYMTATGQQLQGASTITQQMARNYFDGLSQEVSIKRKVNEIFVAVKLDDTMSKDKILETYLNTVNFGRAYGVQAAAKAYFGKDVTAAKLTPEQSAYLAARIQQPNWDADEPALRARFKNVIDNMAELWPDKYGQLKQTAQFPKTEKYRDTNVLGGLKGYMVEEVLKELEARGLTSDEIESGGYQIISTFDRRLMLAAKEAVTTTMSGMNKEFHAGLAAVDPSNGRVVAFYGGSDYITDPWNEPFESKKQAASAFKPYVLAAWLQAGYSLKSYVPGSDTVPEKIPGFERGLRNSHNVGRAVDVVKATADSVNTAFVSMAFALPNKIDDVKNLVEAAGFNQKDMEKDIADHQYQFAIGSAPVTPVEQAAGYSIFANGGKYTRYHVVKEVKLNKKVVYPEQRVSKRVIDEGVAADATVAMQAVLQRGTARGQGLGSRPAAGKTGTNNDENGAWFVGYTPQYSAAVGFYREECRRKDGTVVPPIHSNCPITPKGKPSKKYNINNPYTRPYEVSLEFEGAGPPTAAWQKFMLLAHEGKPIEQFPQKADYGQPQNIVPSPTPTPSPTPSADEDPFTNEDPFAEDDPSTGDQGCLFPPCNDGATGDDGTTGDDGIGEDTDDGFPQGGDDGGFGGGLAPAPRPTGREEGW
ncbi:transglycosylase domain-containing protein [Nonomuraea sp. NPDC049480]|uniref:transglycosylase domain-containing protein n=1 Tax=Nonomuraea sp. NPDC049480 TaxID=3364353 RepID=UPI00379B6DE7